MNVLMIFFTLDRYGFIIWRHLFPVYICITNNFISDVCSITFIISNDGF